MLPAGRRSEAFFVPLKIWSNTGTFGDAKDSPLTANLPAFYSWGRVRYKLAKDGHLLTNEIFRLMLMSAPPGVCAPGCSSGLGFSNDQDEVKHCGVTYNSCRLQRLGKTISVQQHMLRSTNVDAHGDWLPRVATCLLGCQSWGPAWDLFRPPQYNGGWPNSSN